MTEDLKCIMPILYSKTSFVGFEFYYVIFLEAFCFLGIFSFSFIFMRFVLLVLCNVIAGSFL